MSIATIEDSETAKYMKCDREIIRQTVNSFYGLPKNTNSSTIYPRNVKRRGRATIVTWTDGTQTKIVLEQGKEDMGLFHAFCVAFAKRYFGSTDKLMKAIERADDERQQAEKKAAKEKEKKEREEQRLRAERKRFKRDVKKRLREKEIEAEVAKRLRADNDDLDMEWYRND